MIKKKNSFFLLISFIIIAIFLNNSNYLLYPYNFIRDLLFYPVHALKDEELTISSNLKNSIITGLQEEIHDLLKINNMTTSLSDFNYVLATVITRNREYWFNNLMINKGSNDGIELDMAVIDSNGLIGRISSVTNNTAMVKLITTFDTTNKISAVINNDHEKVYGIINGYDSKNNLLNLIITQNIEIVKGSRVLTTGMGGVFPSNILIGTVFDTMKDSDDITNIVRVIPSSNIEGERYVAVLQRKEISNN